MHRHLRPIFRAYRLRCVMSTTLLKYSPHFSNLDDLASDMLHILSPLASAPLASAPLASTPPSNPLSPSTSTRLTPPADQRQD